MRVSIRISLAAALIAVAAGTSAQPRRVPPPPIQPPMAMPMPMMLSPEQLQSDLRIKAGSDTVRFERDSFMLDAAARATLGRQALWLLTNPWARVSIEGHADVRQPGDYALALGERRASAVRNFLITQGVPPGQMDVVSWGRERPVAAAVHDAAWLQNGRVETRVVR